MPDPIKCTVCHRQVASTVTVAGVEHLHAGNLALREVHGRCIHCGAQFHWTAKDAQFDAVIAVVQDPRLAALIDRVMKFRCEYGENSGMWDDIVREFCEGEL